MRRRADIRKSMVLPTNVSELADQGTPLDRIRIEANDDGTEMRASIVFDLGFGQRLDQEYHDVSQILSVPGHQEALMEGLRAWMRFGNSKLSRDTMRLSLTEGWCLFAQSKEACKGIDVSQLTLEEITPRILWAFVTWLNQKQTNGSGPRWSKSTRRIRFLALRKVLEVLADYPNPWRETAISLGKRSVLQQTHWPRVAEASVPTPTVERDELIQIVEAAEQEIKETASVWREGRELIALGKKKLVMSKEYTAAELRNDRSLALAWMVNRYDGMLPQSLVAQKNDRILFNLVFSQKGGQGLNSFRRYLYSSLRVIIPFFIILLVRTRWNVSTLAGLKLSDIQMMERFGESVIILEPTKARANYRRQPVTLHTGNSEDPLSNGSVLRLLRKLTDRVRSEAVPAENDRLMLANPDSVRRISDLNNLDLRAGAFRDFCSENGLGFFTPSQIRPTIIDLIVRETGNLLTGAKEANHKSIRTTANRYIRHRTKEKFKTQLGGLVMLGHRWATSSGKIDPRHIGAGADKFASTPGFHCFDPYNSPVAGQLSGRLCNAYGRCPTCPMMLFAVEDVRDVASAMALANAIERTRYKVTTETWINIWQPQLDAINSLLCQVSASVKKNASSLPVPKFPDPS